MSGPRHDLLAPDRAYVRLEKMTPPILPCPGCGRLSRHFVLTSRDKGGEGFLLCTVERSKKRRVR